MQMKTSFPQQGFLLESCSRSPDGADFATVQWHKACESPLLAFPKCVYVEIEWQLIYCLCFSKIERVYNRLQTVRAVLVWLKTRWDLLDLISVCSIPFSDFMTIAIRSCFNLCAQDPPPSPRAVPGAASNRVTQWPKTPVCTRSCVWTSAAWSPSTLGRYQAKTRRRRRRRALCSVQCAVVKRPWCDLEILVHRT